MTWEKLGFSLNLNVQKNEWQSSHAMMPVVLEKENCLRIFYTTRHVDGRSRITYYDVDKNDPTKIIYFHNQPLLDVGAKGTFDDCGTVATFVIRDNEKIYLYYNGYNVRNTVPWSNSIGIAVSYDDGYTFEKLFNGPIMDRYKDDNYFSISPSILKDGETWHMWYTSGIGWLEVNGKMEPIYDIKYAFSTNGIDWVRDFKVAIPQHYPEECTARATTIREGDLLRMWYIYRGSRDFRDGKGSYRIGYAEANIKSPANWIRKDDICGIQIGPEEYDKFMQAYPCVIKVNGKIFMFYNGNGFGEQGILCAYLKEM